jgi:hypothetical protein
MKGEATHTRGCVVVMAGSARRMSTTCSSIDPGAIRAFFFACFLLSPSAVLGKLAKPSWGFYMVRPQAAILVHSSQHEALTLSLFFFFLPAEHTYTQPTTHTPGGLGSLV